MKHKKEGKEKNKKRKIIIKKYQENTGEGKHHCKHFSIMDKCSINLSERYRQ
jgi:hypothetical protein